jgi:hypothetical protein
MTNMSVYNASCLSPTLRNLTSRLRRNAGKGQSLGPDARERLERGLGRNLVALCIHDDAEADALTRQLGAIAFACGNDLYFRSGAYRPSTSSGMALLAHEAAHAMQQASATVGDGQGIWVNRGEDEWETLAHRAAERVLAGKRADVMPICAGRRRPTDESGLVIQRHSSFEHRMLGDTPTDHLMAIATKQATRPQYLQQERTLMGLWSQNPKAVTADQIAKICPWVRTVRLKESNLLVTYGELNSLPDYVATAVAMDRLPENILLPILQQVRQQSYNRMSDMLGVDGIPKFPNAVSRDWGPGLFNTLLETSAMNDLTANLGIKGSDHYNGILARNACHFAPYSWYRWQASYTIARDLAVKAYNASGGDKDKLTHDAWVYHGYADHFLQDSFAAGHLVNKTLIMQWYVQWAANDSWPFADWDTVKYMMVENQPGLAGMHLYDTAYHGPSNDPQTCQEYATYPERRNATGVRGYGSVTQDMAYQQYLTFLNSLITQSASAALHDRLNERSVWVASKASGLPAKYQLFGDDSLLHESQDGSQGVRITSETAQMSQQSILELLARGATSITTQQILDRFPTSAMDSKGNLVSLKEWQNSVHEECTTGSDAIFPALHQFLVRTLKPRMGVVSQDQQDVATALKMKVYNLKTGASLGYMGHGGDYYVQLVDQGSAIDLKWETSGDNLYLAYAKHWLGEGGGAWKGYAAWALTSDFYCAVIWNDDHTVSMKSDSGRKLYKYHSFSKDWLCWTDSGDSNNSDIVRVEWE